ncbi:Hypothetical protein CINCED_3A020496 [Cinara cedri]|uniref:Uncharacterized protein n=1 Tax=Cinara cedri TaxID=506608 RepID=A0A5E4MD82_9HEMI|nr:Hypothetical protein CINCED_3A020496 [Cinara cedri]
MTKNINEIKIKNKITEINDNIFNSPPEFAIAHCVSADLRMTKCVAKDLCEIYGNTRSELANYKPKTGNTLVTRCGSRTIFHLVTRAKCYTKPTYNDIITAIKNLKREAIKYNQTEIAMPTIASRLNGHDPMTIKQLTQSEFQNSNIKIYLYYYKNNQIIRNSETQEPNATAIDRYIPDNNLSLDKNTDSLDIINARKIFLKYKPGENVLADGNCGLYAVCNAINDNKMERITSISEILELIGLNELPDYWWSDEQLASIAAHYGHDTYVFNDSNNTGIVHGIGNKPPIVLYNVNSNTHWIPGTISRYNSNKIPDKIIYINNLPSIDTIKKKLNLEQVIDQVNL